MVSKIPKWLKVVCVGGIIVLLGGFILMREAAFLFPKPVAELSREEIEAAIKNAGGEQRLEKEATEAIVRLGRKNGLWDLIKHPMPSIAKMASKIGGEFVPILPANPGLPAHIEIRRGGHFNYQFIYIFGSGSPPPSVSENLISVGGSVYFRNTGGASSHESWGIQSICNGDIKWHGSTVGFIPEFTWGSRKVLNARMIQYEELVDALKDERRYVAAHALLTELTGYRIEAASGGIDPVTGKVDHPEILAVFNGFRLDLLADGMVVIPEKQREGLEAKWRAWLRLRK